MNIIYSSDDNYAEIMGVSILSLLENTLVNEIHIYILDNGISDENKRKLLSLVDFYSSKITFIDMTYIEEIVDVPIDAGHLSMATFSRLFIASALPENVNKALYIDCDTLIRSSIEHLFNESLEEYIIGGVLDNITKLQKKLIFHESNDIYINAGVILIDVSKWRKFNIENRFINYIRLFNGIVPHKDQGVINGVLKSHIKLLHPKYNYMAFLRKRTRRDLVKQTGVLNYYSESIIEEANNFPVVLHIVNGDNRPWIKGNTHYFQAEYMRYRNMTPWAGSPLREQSASSVFVFMKKKILKLLPQIILNWICSGKILMQYHYSKKCLKNSTVRLEELCTNIKEVNT